MPTSVKRSWLRKRSCAVFPDGGVIALLGLSFKPETDDIRESPAVEIAGALLADGRYTVRMYDPKALENARRQLGGQANAVWCGSKKEALDNADAVVIANGVERICLHGSGGAGQQPETAGAV